MYTSFIRRFERERLNENEKLGDYGEQAINNYNKNVNEFKF